MYARTIEIVNPTGIHARPAAEFVHLAGRFRSLIEVRREGEEDLYNGKSIIMLLAAGLSKGERAVISASGEDEKEAVEALCALVENWKE